MTRDDAYDPRAIANKILDIRSESEQPLTIMQLIKLAYIADGWSLALLDKPLANENPEAWRYGPVYPSIYNAFSGIGDRPVMKRACVRGTQIPITEEFAPQEEELLRKVVNSYGKLNAFTLSNLTHQPGTPWSKAYEHDVYSDINTDDIKRHFESLKAKRLVKNKTAQPA